MVWEAYFSHLNPERVDIPTTAFQRQHLWCAPGPEGDRSDESTLITHQQDIAETQQHLTVGQFSTTTDPWLEHHAISRTVIVPATALLDLVLESSATIDCDLSDAR